LRFDRQFVESEGHERLSCLSKKNGPQSGPL
jgi:hypothetical protein